MQVYFVKATYTNNVYKLSDFFLNGDYKKVATKMLDFNFIANDDQTFIKGTSKLTLPDGTSVREYTHIIVPDYDKIYRITDIVYLNVSQVNINLTEDPTIGNYLELETKDVFLQRTNDVSLFRGQNDISDLTLKESVQTKVIESNWKTGKWALLFFQYTDDTDYLGLVMEGSQVFEEHTNLTAILAAYPEVATEEPSKYEYFQKIVLNLDDGFAYQCVYDNSTGSGRLYWVAYGALSITYDKVFIKKAGVGAKISPTKINPVEVKSIIVALPIESDLFIGTDRLLEYNNFVGPEDSALLMDIKIVESLLIKNSTLTYNLTGADNRTMKKAIAFANNTAEGKTVYSDNVGTVIADLNILVMYDFESDIDISANFDVTTLDPKKAEPFYKYELYIYGNRFSIPYYLSNDIHMLISVVSGVINFTVYYNDKRNILGSGSFTHTIKYQVDQLDAFYSQNPTYKDQFYLKLGGNAFKTVAGGALAGGAGAGVGVGATTGLLTAALDAGLALANYQYMEKGLTLKPDQIYGEISEVSLQLENIFGVYWVKRTPENQDLMLQEYNLRGFPTSYAESIENLDYAANTLFGSAKIIFGEIKSVVKNEYATKAINEKLKQGIIFVP